MLDWKQVSPFVKKEFAKYEYIRAISISERHFLNQFL